MGRATATAFDELGCFAHKLARIQTAFGNKVFPYHHREQRLTFARTSQDAEHLSGQHVRNLERQVFHGIGRDGTRDDSAHQFHAAYILCLTYKAVTHNHNVFLDKLFHPFFQGAVVFHRLLDGGGQVFGVIEQLTETDKQVFLRVAHFFGHPARNSLNPAHTGSHAAFGQDAEKSQAPFA